MNLYYDWIDTPLGSMLAVASDEGLRGLDFVEIGRAAEKLAPLLARGAMQNAARLHEVASQVGEYFAGGRETFALPLAPRGSAFQLRVWRELTGIVYGATMSYGALARRLHSSPRAVGRANATNPIALIVPCHRVIGSDGTLTGYAGGLARKSALLALERGKRAGCAAAEQRAPDLV